MPESRFVASGRDLDVTVVEAPAAHPPAEPAVGALPDGVSDGDIVTARLLGDSGELATAEPVPLPAERMVTGPLAVRWVETLGVFRYSVNGRSVDPASVTPAVGA